MAAADWQHPHEEKRAVAVSAALFAFGTFLSRILGLLRDMMTARYFPIEVRDAFIVAFRLPNLFRRILGEGSLSISFIPVFVQTLSAQDREKARHLVNGVYSILLSICITLSLLSLVFMEEILAVLVGGEEYMKVPGKFELTVRLSRIMFAFLILISLYAFFMAILNSLKKFALTALAPCFFNISLIAAALISDKWARPEEVLAWSVIVGGFLQMGVLIPAVVRAGYWPRFTVHWRTPEVLKVFKSIGPSIFGMSIMQVTTLVNLHFASYLPQGSHSYLYFADRILELPLAMFVVSVGSALLPTLSQHWARGERQAMADTLNHYLRLILFVSVPAAVGMFFLAQPITEVLFLGREFKFSDAVATAQVIQVYAFTLIVAGGVRILAQGFYAVQNTWFPAVAAAVALVAHVVFAYFLTRSWGLIGLAAATVASATVNLVLLSYAYNAWISLLGFRSLAKSFLKYLLCAAGLVGGLQVYNPILQALGASVMGQTIALLAAIGLGALAYFVCAHILQIPEYKETLETFTQKIRRKFKKRA